MRLFLLVTIICFAALPGNAQTQKPQAKSSPQEKTAVPPLKLKNYRDSVQYALGAYMGAYMLTSGFLTIDMDYFMAGLEDVFNRKPGLLKDSTITALLASYQDKVQKARSKDLEEQLFTSLKDKAGIGKLPSGVQYLVVRSAKGPKPNETDSVKIHFRQRLADGQIVEDTYARNMPTTTTPGTLIPGLNEVLQLMSVGSVWQVFIPSSLGYGAQGKGIIPPNAALQFEIELLEIKK